MESIRISDEFVVDVSPDGKVYGIELLNANQQLQREGEGKILFINEATSQKAEVAL